MTTMSLAKKVINPQVQAIIDIHRFYILPNLVSDQLWACDLPAPQVFNKLTAHGPRPRVAFLHKRSNPLGVQKPSAQLT